MRCIQLFVVLLFHRLNTMASSMETLDALYLNAKSVVDAVVLPQLQLLRQFEIGNRESNECLTTVQGHLYGEGCEVMYSVFALAVLRHLADNRPHLLDLDALRTFEYDEQDEMDDFEHIAQLYLDKNASKHVRLNMRPFPVTVSLCEFPGQHTYILFSMDNLVAGNEVIVDLTFKRMLVPHRYMDDELYWVMQERGLFDAFPKYFVGTMEQLNRLWSNEDMLGVLEFLHYVTERPFHSNNIDSTLRRKAFPSELAKTCKSNG